MPSFGLVSWLAPEGLNALPLPAGKTFTQLGKELGLTNAYTAQLFYNQVGSQSLHIGSWPFSRLLTKFLT